MSTEHAQVHALVTRIPPDRRGYDEDAPAWGHPGTEVLLADRPEMRTSLVLNALAELFGLAVPQRFDLTDREDRDAVWKIAREAKLLLELLRLDIEEHEQKEGPMTHQKRTRRGVVVAHTPDGERHYVASRRLRWADGWIEAGEEIPFERGGRNMANLVREGLIVELPAKGRS